MVESILLAAREELAKVGYRALRIEDVAARAGVHKTTIYRRFPEKIDLVRETMQGLFLENFEGMDTGSLYGDLLVFGRKMSTFFSSVEGQSLVRMMTTEGTDPELQSIVATLRASKEALPNEVIAKAIERGELPKGMDGKLIFETLVGAIHHRLFAMGQCVTEFNLEVLVKLLVYGAVPRNPVTPERPSKRNRSLR